MSNPMLKYLFTVVISSFVFCLDQATKIFAHTHIKMEEPIVVISWFFNLAYVRNTGGAFGLFGDSHVLVRFILFLFFPLVCIFLILMILKDTRNRFQILALSFILGGALGNYIDRVRMGYVVDFIDWHVNNLWHWPTFNLADTFIVIGVLILLFFYSKEMLEERKKSVA